MRRFCNPTTLTLKFIVFARILISPKMGVWSTPLCGCREDGRNCFKGTFCPCLLIINSANQLGKSGIACCLLGIIMPCLPIFLLRRDTRYSLILCVNISRGEKCHVFVSQIFIISLFWGHFYCQLAL